MTTSYFIVDYRSSSSERSCSSLISNKSRPAEKSVGATKKDPKTHPNDTKERQNTERVHLQFLMHNDLACVHTD